MDVAKLAELGRLRQRLAELETELGLRGERAALPVEAIEASELLPLVLRFSSDMISVHAANGNYLYVSPSVRVLLGWEPEDLVGSNAYELFHPEDLARVAASHAVHTEVEQDLGTTSQRLTYRLRAKDGSWRWVETTSQAHASGAVHEIVCVTRDAQAQVQAQEALLETNRRLEHFAAGVAHDLKAPLMVVSAHASLLELTGGAALGPDQRHRLERIRKASETMGAQIDALLRWARSGAEARTDTLTDLNELVGEVLGTLAMDIEAQGARVEVGALPTLPLDPSLGRVLLQNLLSNALKYGQPGVVPAIHVRACRSSTAWDLQVEDNGRGIPSRDHQRIFGMFERGTDSEPGGHGVGLAMCARIAELHKGRLWVESTPGQGSTFHLELPLTEESEACAS